MRVPRNPALAGNKLVGPPAGVAACPAHTFAHAGALATSHRTRRSDPRAVPAHRSRQRRRSDRGRRHRARLGQLTLAHSLSRPLACADQIGIGGFTTTQTLHFVINEGLMTSSFWSRAWKSVASSRRRAIEPAFRGTSDRRGHRRRVAPALIYLSMNWTRIAEGGRCRSRPTSPLRSACSRCSAVRFLGHSRVAAGARDHRRHRGRARHRDRVFARLDFAGACIALAAIALVLLIRRFGIRTAVAYVTGRNAVVRPVSPWRPSDARWRDPRADHAGAAACAREASDALPQDLAVTRSAP